jgi:hypothetical protein
MTTHTFPLAPALNEIRDGLRALHEIDPAMASALLRGFQQIVRDIAPHDFDDDPTNVRVPGPAKKGNP